MAENKNYLRIKSCSNFEWWYKDFIGYCLEIESLKFGVWIVKHDSKTLSKFPNENPLFIHPKDAEFIESYSAAE